MTKVIRLLLIMLFFLSFVDELQAEVFPAWSARVIRVSDGDTITIQDSTGTKTRIRVYGIDCPELAQDRGREARDYLQATLLDKRVAIEGIEVDRYGRTVGFVYYGGRSVQEILLEQGLAWVYEKYCLLPICNRYKEIERLSRENKIGLWGTDNPIAPWKWRRQQRLQRKNHLNPRA